MRYSSSLFDEPVRPLIRFLSGEGDSITLPMNGPVLGAADWIGRVPKNTVSAFISPVRRTGPFDFRLESISSVSRAELVLRGLRRFDWLYWASRSRLLNSRREAWQALSFAAGGTPMSAYRDWYTRFARPMEFAGMDRARTDWLRGPVFRIVLDLSEGHPDLLRRTIASLRAQIYPHWFVYAVTEATTAPLLLSEYREQARDEARMLEAGFDYGDWYESGDFLTVMYPGDSLAEFALAVVAEEIARLPDLDFIYGDEDSVTPDGSRHSPVLKPDWSPILQKQHGYLGRCIFFRASAMTPQRLRQLLADRQALISEITRDLPRQNIRHVRRVLYSRSSLPQVEESKLTAVRLARETDSEPRWPDVAVVIATRDRAKLLAQCFKGLRDKTDYPHREIIVVDNGSTEPDAVRLLEKVSREPRTKVLREPGPFNFSALSNVGAAAASAPVLLFLNNDVVMLDPGWLKAMVRWAINPEIGVVGAKLQFANGRIQHAGVVLGFGGIAGHVYRRLPKDYRGYLSQLTVPHEVTAVTAACIAVERSKFEAVGGFDAENLPVDLNDIDLCLRIAERGWANLWTPEATLIHLQSATRGIDSDPFALYRRERNYFVQRWSHVMRDDPFFHPGLSLYAHEVALA
jgi:GT2 family glycosyltransferase